MSNYYLIVVLFYFILKFTRISEFGVDLPAAVFSILAIYYFIKFSETNLIELREECFYLISLFSIFFKPSPNIFSIDLTDLTIFLKDSGFWANL